MKKQVHFAVHVVTAFGVQEGKALVGARFMRRKLA